jgi:nucleotide-binding universal stress UspA family protein
MSPDSSDGPVLFAYDGSEYAKAAIAEAGSQLRSGRKAIVLAVWEPLESLPFWGAPMSRVPPEMIQDAESEAEKLAAEGAELAKQAGFDAEPGAVEGSPVWQKIVEAAEERGAGTIVTGTHGRSGVAYVALGSVATAVAHHAKVPVLICGLPS